MNATLKKPIHQISLYILSPFLRFQLQNPITRLSGKVIKKLKRNFSFRLTNSLGYGGTIILEPNTGECRGG
jgi:hypothetical protein